MATERAGVIKTEVQAAVRKPIRQLLDQIKAVRAYESGLAISDAPAGWPFLAHTSANPPRLALPEGYSGGFAPKMPFPA